MVERFFDELRRGVPGAAADKVTDPPEQNEKSHSDTKRDESFLAAVPTVRQIVWRKLFARKPDDAPDLIQKVILQLLTWRKNNPNTIEEMTAEEWQSFASKAAHNAVNNSLSNGSDHLNVPLDKASEIATDDQVAGNTKAELASLLSRFWQGIC